MPEATNFLYPFIEADERDAAPLLADLSASAGTKWAESEALRLRTLDAGRAAISGAATDMAGRFRAGGSLFTFGNGGSSTDAGALADRFARPPAGRPLPARSLAADPAVLTALANDIGFDVVFSRQLIAHGRAGDIAVGISTSGNSVNVLAAFGEARKRGILTVGIAGYDGGAMAASPDVDHSIVVRSDSVHRVQEAQVAIGAALWAAVQHELGRWT